MKIKLLYLLLVITWSIPALAQDGAISNVVVNHRTDGSGYVDIYYNLAGSGNCYQVTAEVSFNNGSSYSAIASNYLTGNAGPTAPGNNKHMVWNGKGSHNNTYSAQTRIRLQASAGNQPVTIGTGNTPQGWPFYTFYMDSRTQMLYTASEIAAAGGSAGLIMAIGFNVEVHSSQAMNGFQIKMKNTSATSLSSGWQTGLTTVYIGTYTVPGTGWQMITLQTPFNWSGSNLVVEICYNNSSYTSNSTVYCTSASNMTQHNHFDGSTTSGCDATTTGIQSYRPNLRLLLNCTPSNPASFIIGSGGSCINTQVNGTYTTGSPLTTLNYVLLQVTVLSPGLYTISTNTMNGFSFSGSGSFPSAGIHMAILAGTGTPVSANTTTLLATGSNLGGSCVFSIVTEQQTVLPCPGIPTITDPRDGQVYTTVQIGSQCWMAMNLNYQTGNSWCYDNNTANCNTNGRLYDWSTALGVCPSGWHLPSDAEWCTLTQYVDPTVSCNTIGSSGTDVGIKMKSTSGWSSGGNGTNESGFTALSGGHRDRFGNFNYFGYFACFWSSSSRINATNHAWYRDLRYTDNGVSRYYDYKSNGYSVRCVRD